MWSGGIFAELWGKCMSKLLYSHAGLGFLNEYSWKMAFQRNWACQISVPGSLVLHWLESSVFFQIFVPWNVFLIIPVAWCSGFCFFSFPVGSSCPQISSCSREACLDSVGVDSSCSLALNSAAPWCLCRDLSPFFHAPFFHLSWYVLKILLMQGALPLVWNGKCQRVFCCGSFPVSSK